MGSGRFWWIFQACFVLWVTVGCGSGLAVVSFLLGQRTGWEPLHEPRHSLMHLDKWSIHCQEFFHVQSKMWVRGNWKWLFLVCPDLSVVLYGKWCHCFSVWRWNWIPFYWLAVAVGDGSFLLSCLWPEQMLSKQNLLLEHFFFGCWCLVSS